MRWTDDHCHLDAPGASDVVAEARRAGVERMITVGTDVASSAVAIELAAAHDGVWATAGVHPHDAAGGIDGLEDLLEADGVVAVGECGLDYHYDHSPRARQREVFASQIGLAHRAGLALVIHTREAWEDTFAILESEGVPSRTVVHCFSGGPDEAERALALGAHLSFSGIVSFAGASEVREAAARCPIERMLVETDSPYLAPVPHRGKKNQPAWVVAVGRALADACDRTVEEVAQATWTNAERVYRIEG